MCGCGFSFTFDWPKKWHEFFKPIVWRSNEKPIVFRLSSENHSFVVVVLVARRHVSHLFRDSPNVVWFKATAASDIPHSHIIGSPSVLMHIPAS